MDINEWHGLFPPGLVPRGTQYENIESRSMDALLLSLDIQTPTLLERTIEGGIRTREAVIVVALGCDRE
jgi:hypothetical protein